MILHVLMLIDIEVIVCIHFKSPPHLPKSINICKYVQGRSPRWSANVVTLVVSQSIRKWMVAPWTSKSIGLFQEKMILAATFHAIKFTSHLALAP